jgi:hypothetical protein
MPGDTFTTPALRESQLENRKSYIVNQNVDFEQFDLKRHSVRGLVEHFSKVEPPPDDAINVAAASGEGAPPLSYLHQQKKHRDDLRRKQKEFNEPDAVNEIFNYQSKNAIKDYLVMDVEGSSRGAGMADPSAILGGSKEQEYTQFKSKKEREKEIVENQTRLISKPLPSEVQLSSALAAPAFQKERLQECIQLDSYRKQERVEIQTEHISKLSSVAPLFSACQAFSKTDLRAVSASPTLALFSQSRIRPPTPKPFVPFGSLAATSTTSAAPTPLSKVAAKPPPSPKPPSRKQHSRPTSAQSRKESEEDDFSIVLRKERFDAMMADLSQPLPTIGDIASSLKSGCLGDYPATNKLMSSNEYTAVSGGGGGGCGVGGGEVGNLGIGRVWATEYGAGVESVDCVGVESVQYVGSIVGGRPEAPSPIEGPALDAEVEMTMSDPPSVTSGCDDDKDDDQAVMFHCSVIASPVTVFQGRDLKKCTDPETKDYIQVRLGQK